MKIAVMALQGAFVEHEQMLRRLGADACEIRNRRDWDAFIAEAALVQGDGTGLILPGGESTVQMRLLHSLDLYEPVRQAIADGLPVMGTCAGMILLSDGYLGTMHMSTLRNAYGRQLGSFHTSGTVGGVGEEIPMTFIRAPYVDRILSDDCLALATIDGNIVAASQGRQIALAFHPELDDDTRLHRHFLNLCSGRAERE